MLSKLKQLKERNEDGFTLIEMMVTLLIIGILTAIAVPVFLNQRKTSNDTTVESDVRNAALTIETMLHESPGAQKIIYIDSTGIICAVLNTTTSCPTGSPKIIKSEGVKLSIAANTSNIRNYTIRGWHTNGKKWTANSGSGATKKYALYDSSTGGMSVD